MAQKISKRVGHDGTTSWHVRLDVGVDPHTGKRRQSRQTFRTKKEAETAVAQWRVDSDQGTLVQDSKMSVAAYLEHWLTTTAQHRVRPTTLQSYTTLVALHIVPSLGSIPLQKLTPTQPQAFYAAKLAPGGRKDGKTDSGLSKRTVRYLHTIMRKGRPGVLPP